MSHVWNKSKSGSRHTIMTNEVNHVADSGGNHGAYTAVRDEARKDFGRKVRSAREEKGMYQEELARLAGLKQTNVSRIESGRYSVTLDTITRLSAVLGDLI